MTNIYDISEMRRYGFLFEVYKLGNVDITQLYDFIDVFEKSKKDISYQIVWTKTLSSGIGGPVVMSEKVVMEAEGEKFSAQQFSTLFKRWKLQQIAKSTREEEPPEKFFM